MTTKGASDTMTFRRSTSCPPLSFNFRVFIVLFVFDFIVFLVVEGWECVELHFKIQFIFLPIWWPACCGLVPGSDWLASNRRAKQKIADERRDG